jgi:hypothetical protein
MKRRKTKGYIYYADDSYSDLPVLASLLSILAFRDPSMTATARLALLFFDPHELQSVTAVSTASMTDGFRVDNTPATQKDLFSKKRVCGSVASSGMEFNTTSQSGPGV